ncbi:MAG: MATE family efflux transporter [Firmicutes bacterium]|nr:MATE family efflux transporter [Bacillota bacterium]
MAMNILQLMFNAADMMVVGRFSSSEALAAVGATGYLINLLVNVFMGLSIGTSVVLAQDYGAGKVEAVRSTVHTSIAISIIGGIAIMILGLATCEPLLNLMGTPQDIIHLSILYMKIYFLGLPASMVYNMFFVISLGMSVDGVAWATVISQYLASAFILWSLMRSNSAIRFRFNRLQVDRGKLRDIVKIGLPAGLQAFLFSISNVLIQSAVNSFGSVVVAASSAADNVEGFLDTTMNAYYNATVIVTGQNTGAGKYDRIDSIAKVCTSLIFATWIILGGVIMIFGPTLLGLYSKNPEVVELGMLRMRLLMGAYFAFGTMTVFPGLSRGMGYSILPMLCTLVGVCLMRIVWLVTIFAWRPTLMVLFACYPVTWIITGLGQVGIFFYVRGQVHKEKSGQISNLI